MTQGEKCHDGNQHDVDACTNACRINFKAVPCDGDCDRSSEVTVDEVLTLVNIALGQDEPASCGPGDMNGDEQITVDEILAALARALQGCG
jgi:hypothetical protein